MKTPKDAYGTPVMLGNYAGKAIPLKVDEQGKLIVAGINLSETSLSVRSGNKYEFVQSVSLDLSVSRNKEVLEVSFDTMAVANIDGEILVYIGESTDKKKITINKCMSMDVSTEAIYISNKAQEGTAEIWFLKLKE